jgi:hypothetical protein
MEEAGLDLVLLLQLLVKGNTLKSKYFNWYSASTRSAVSIGIR